MAYEGMVYALEEIRRLLRPHGALIDIHPHPNFLFLQAQIGERVLAVEAKPQTYSQDVLQAEEALDNAARRGLFVLEATQEFDFLTYGSSIDEIRDHWEEINAYDDSPKDSQLLLTEEEQYERFRSILEAAGANAEVLIHERARINRLRPKSVVS